MELKNCNPSGWDFAHRPNWIDLGFDYNDSLFKKKIAIIVTSWWGHLPFMEATLSQYKKTNAFVLCAYDNPIFPWEKEPRIFYDRMPTFEIWKLPDTWCFKHNTYDNEKRNGWLWLMQYAKGILQTSKFDYILHVNSDCIWEKPEGLPDLIKELGNCDIMSISSQENNIHTCAAIYKGTAFFKIFDFISSFISPPVLGSFSPEELLTMTVKNLELKERVAPIQPMELDNSSVDHYSRYNQNSTWKELVGYRNLGSEFLTCLIERTEPINPEYINIELMEKSMKGYSNSLGMYYKTKDRRWLYKAWDENEDSWYNRLHMPIEYYGDKPILEPEDNIFEKTKLIM